MHIGYDKASLDGESIDYDGPVSTDYYGRRVPRHAHGTAKFSGHTSSGHIIADQIAALFDRIVNPALFMRRLTLSAMNLACEVSLSPTLRPEQLELFTDYDEVAKRRKAEAEALARERRRQQAILNIKKKFGKNAILKGLNFADGATQRERNSFIGGHHS